MTPSVPAARLPRITRMVGGLAIVAIVGALLGDASYFLLPGGSDWRERRLARRILAAT
jgi:hypothetical protein